MSHLFENDTPDEIKNAKVQLAILIFLLFPPLISVSVGASPHYTEHTKWTESADNARGASGCLWHHLDHNFDVGFRPGRISIEEIGIQI